MLILDRNNNIPLYIQMYSQLRDKILSGELCEGYKLPPIRIIANSLMIARNTVESAYQQLASEGYIIGKMGSGYTVQKIDLKQDEQPPRACDPNRSITDLDKTHEQGVSKFKGYNFQYGRLDSSEFPARIWRTLLNQILLSNEARCITAYAERKGNMDLRIEIMKYLDESRGVICRPEQIIVTSGAMSGIGLACQVIGRSIDRVAVENPCFDTARETIANYGYSIVPIDIQNDGVDLEQLQFSGAKMIYTTPSHQFPSGVVMPVNKRLNLLAWANHNDAYIIEDDYDSEFRYNSRPIPSISSLDNNGRVIYVNTLSKSLAPSLRIGFVVLPEQLLKIYNSNFANYNCSVSWLDQKVLYHFMNEGHWCRLLNKASVSNRKKHDALIGAIKEFMGSNVVIHGENAGMHILLEVNNGMNEQQLIDAARKAAVKVHPVSIYWVNPKNYTDNMVMIGYSSLSEKSIVAGIKLLSSAWF